MQLRPHHQRHGTGSHVHILRRQGRLQRRRARLHDDGMLIGIQPGVAFHVGKIPQLHRRVAQQGLHVAGLIAGREEGGIHRSRLHRLQHVCVAQLHRLDRAADLRRKMRQQARHHAVRTAPRRTDGHPLALQGCPESRPGCDRGAMEQPERLIGDAAQTLHLLHNGKPRLGKAHVSLAFADQVEVVRRPPRVHILHPDALFRQFRCIALGHGSDTGIGLSLGDAEGVWWQGENKIGQHGQRGEQQQPCGPLPPQHPGRSHDFVAHGVSNVAAYAGVFLAGMVFCAHIPSCVPSRSLNCQ